MTRKLLKVGFVGAVVMLCWISYWWSTNFNCKIEIGEDTTHLTEPVDEEGYVDHLQWLEDVCKDGIEPERNLVRAVWKNVGTHGKLDGPIFNDYISKLRLRAEDFSDPPIFSADAYSKTKVTRSDRVDFVGDVTRSEWAAKLDADLVRLSGQRWRSGSFPIVEEYLNTNEQALDRFVVEFSSCDQYYSPVLLPDPSHRSMLTMMLPDVDQIRSLATLFAVRINTRIGNVSSESLLRDALALRRLSRIRARYTHLISLQISYVIERLAARSEWLIAKHHDLTLTEVQSYLADMAKLPSMANPTVSIDTAERFSLLNTVILAAKTGELAGNQHDDGITGYVLKHGVDHNIALRRINRVFDSIAEASTEPDYAKRVRSIKHVVKTVVDEAEARHDGRKYNFLLGRTKGSLGRQMADMWLTMLLVDASLVITSQGETASANELARVSLALSAFKSENGSYPKSLGELKPKFLKDIPIDPLSRQEFIYAVKDESFELYGIGMNKTDDGGKQAKSASNDDIWLEELREEGDK